jgi:uncharacterized spore protein YtfJ
MENLNEMLGKITEFLKSEAKTETIIGQQFKLGEFTCVPVMSIGIGFGGGKGEARGSGKNTTEDANVGTGGAGGLGMGPVGFLVTKDHDIQFISASSPKGLNAIIDKLPELLDKFSDKNKDVKTP